MSDNYLKYKLSYIIPYIPNEQEVDKNISFLSNELKSNNENNENKKIIEKSEQINERCKYCNKLFLKEKYQLHLKKCLLNFAECKYCTLNVAKTDVKNHEYNCGSRTDHCLDCLSVVRIRELDVHKQFLCKKRNKK
jgi:hypothetical protein